jgi:hypothetical protein
MGRAQHTTAAGVKCTLGNGSMVGVPDQVSGQHRPPVLEFNVQDRADSKQACRQQMQ